MKKLIGAFLSCLVALSSALAQWDRKPYSDWSEKEAAKLLSDSPWAQTQTFSDLSQLTGNARLASGASRIGEEFHVNFRIRFLSARPVRQATARMMEIQNKGELSAPLEKQLRAFAAADFPDYVVITVTVDSPRPSNHLQQATLMLAKMTTADLQNNTYLLAGNGQKVFIKEYQPPRNDGLGARFIFPRLIDGKPFIMAETESVLFHSEMMAAKATSSPGSDPAQQVGPSPSSSITPFSEFILNMRFKIRDMMFGGKLEY
ncbi:MAG: hypothetical protein AB1631_14895 [Acidobacteriota bacterium]